MSIKETNIDHLKEQMRYSGFSLVGEICYLHISPILAARIVAESTDGESVILEAVNKYNEILDDEYPEHLPCTLRDQSEIKSEDHELFSERAERPGYYEPLVSRNW